MTAALFAQSQVTPRYGARPLSQLTANSGYIFAGTVTSISLPSPEKNSVQITFHVETGIRGVRSGQNLAIREWTGLWNSGQQYRVGERVLLYLFRPGKLGLTSPVGGALGKLTVDAQGNVLLNPSQIAAISADPVLPGSWQGKSSVPLKEFSRVMFATSSK